MARVSRTDLPVDALAAYQRVDELLDELEDDRRYLIALRDQVLARELVGSARGGQSRAADALGVSRVQVFRLLSEGVMRAVKVAFETAEVPADAYTAVASKGGRVNLNWVDALFDEGPEVTRLNVAGLLLDCWHEAGIPAEAENPADDVRTALANGHTIYVGPANGS